MTFFTAPMPGIAFRPVSRAPLSTPFRRIVETTVAAAMAAPRIGIERDMRREKRAPPHRASLCPMLMQSILQSAFPRALQYC